MSDLKASFDWEFLESGLIIHGDSIKPSTSLQPHPEKIIINRNEDYYISTHIEGTGSQPGKEYDVRTTKPGETIIGEDITISPNPIEELTLHKIITNQRTTRGDGLFTLRANLHKISRKFSTNDKAATAIVYALNCPDLSWSSTTDRTFDGSLKVNSGGASFSTTFESSYEFGHKESSHSRDCVVLTNKYGKVILTQSGYTNIEKLSPCTIHFIEGDSVFDDTYQKKWIEALGFFFGERLISVGSSNLSSKGHIVEQISHNPYAYDLKMEIARPGLKPFEVNGDDGFVDEIKMAKAIECFLDNYEQLKLGDAIWKMWYGRMMPLGINLASYSSSLESLVEAWFKSNKTKSHGTYMDSTEFNQELAPFLDSIRTKHKSNAIWEKIVKHLENANRISIADKYAKFFQELDIEYGDVEKEVIASRNKFAHGGTVDADKANYAIKAARAFETTIARCIIKAVGAADVYYDYSEYGFPLRPIKNKMKGAKGTYELLPK